MPELVIDQLPVPFDVPLPKTVLLTRRSTSVLGAAVPLYLGVVTPVVLSPLVPSSDAGSSTGVLGTGGATVSMTTERADVWALWPTPLEARAVTLYVPSVR